MQTRKRTAEASTSSSRKKPRAVKSLTNMSNSEAAEPSTSRRRNSVDVDQNNANTTHKRCTRSNKIFQLENSQNQGNPDKQTKQNKKYSANNEIDHSSSVGKGKNTTGEEEDINPDISNKKSNAKTKKIAELEVIPPGKDSRNFSKGKKISLDEDYAHANDERNMSEVEMYTDEYNSDYSYDSYYDSDPESGSNPMYDSILSGLKSGDENVQLCSLTQLSETLLMAEERDLIRGFKTPDFVKALLVLLKTRSNPELLVLLVRTVANLCDAIPVASHYLVKEGILPQLCNVMSSVEYIDLAEESTQALAIIAEECPIECLKAGALNVVLSKFDFHSISVQRDSVKAAASMCVMMPRDSFDYVAESIPTLTKLLQYPDTQVVEHTCACFKKIIKSFAWSSEKLEIICSYGLISETVRLISGYSIKPPQTETANHTYTGLIKMISQCINGSKVVADALLRTNIASALKDILVGSPLSTNNISSEQLVEVLDVVCSLFRYRSTSTDPDSSTVFHSGSDLRIQFARDLFLILLRTYEMCVTPALRHTCLNAIHMLINCLIRSEVQHSIFQEVNISNFLTGLFMTKDYSLQIIGLEISGLLMQKFENFFAKLFLKEGLVQTISTQLLQSPKLRCIHKKGDKEKTDLHSVAVAKAKNFKETYFPGDSFEARMKKLKKLKKLTRQLKKLKSDSRSTRALVELVTTLETGEYVSNYEFLNSGVTESLVDYLSVSVNGYLAGRLSLAEHKQKALGRLYQFISVCIADNSETLTPFLTVIVRHLQNALSTLQCFTTDSSSAIRLSFLTQPLKLQLVREPSELGLQDYSADVMCVGPLITLSAVEELIWPTVEKPSGPETRGVAARRLSNYKVGNGDYSDKYLIESEVADNWDTIQLAFDKQHINVFEIERNDMTFAPDRLLFSIGGKQLDKNVTLLEALRNLLQRNGEDCIRKLWGGMHVVNYQLRSSHKRKTRRGPKVSSQLDSLLDNLIKKRLPCDMQNGNPVYNILLLLHILHGLNCIVPEMDEGNVQVDRTIIYEMRNSRAIIPKEEFLNSKLTTKIDHQMQDAMALCSGGMPLWCHQLMQACPFLFPFETRRKYFCLTALGLPRAVNYLYQHEAQGNTVPNQRWPQVGRLGRRKVRIPRDCILDSATKVMHLFAGDQRVLEVEFCGEVGIGIGPTLEFYTLVSHELQKDCMGMWWHSLDFEKPKDQNTENIICYRPHGLFPQPLQPSNSQNYYRILDRFRLLGQVVGKALQDGRILDLPLSSPFLKLMVGKSLDLYDIKLFNLELGKNLEEMKSVVDKMKHSQKDNLLFRGSTIEELCLDFTLPGYPQYSLKPGGESIMVNINNLEQYVKLVVDASVNTGVLYQMDAFQRGFNQVFPMSSLQIFNEEELSNMLCGYQGMWVTETLLDHIKFDHGYDENSPPIKFLIEIMGEFNLEQQRAFLQFVTGAPKPPCGGLSALHPRLTVVKKHPSVSLSAATHVTNLADKELPSAMTCANYLKLPPYSSKEIMKDRLLYAICEGQGCFDLS